MPPLCGASLGGARSSYLQLEDTYRERVLEEQARERQLEARRAEELSRLADAREHYMRLKRVRSPISR